jgi:hypothetical protein
MDHITIPLVMHKATSETQALAKASSVIDRRDVCIYPMKARLTRLGSRILDCSHTRAHSGALRFSSGKTATHAAALQPFLQDSFVLRSPSAAPQRHLQLQMEGNSNTDNEG